MAAAPTLLLLAAASSVLVAVARADANCTFATEEWCALKYREGCVDSPTVCGPCMDGYSGAVASNDACIPTGAPIISATDKDIYLSVSSGQKVVVQIGSDEIDIGELMKDLKQTREDLKGALNRIDELESTTIRQLKSTCAADESIQHIQADGTITCMKKYEPDFDAVQRRLQNDCPSGTLMQKVGKDGTVTCIADSDTIYQPDFGVVQKRLQNDCGGNQYVQKVGEDGAVTCKTDQDTIYTPDFSKISACPPGETITAFNTDGSVSCATAYSPDFGVVQKRVVSTCPAGTRMYGINEAGNALCENIPIEEFDDKDASGWSDQTLHTDLGANDVMHGIFDKSVPFIQKTYTGLGTHCGLRVSFRYWALDSWDANEWATAKVDGNIVWKDKRYYTGNDYASCLYDWKNYHGTMKNVWSDDNQKCYQDVSTVVPHTADKFTLRFEALLSDTLSDESWGVSSIHIEVLDVCPSQEITLPEDTADARWSNAGRIHDVEPSLGVVHGIFDGRSQNVERTYYLYHLPHCKINLKARVWAIDSWDNEYARIYVDGAQKWIKQRTDPRNCGSGGWLDYKGYMPAPWENTNQGRCYSDVDITFAHTQPTLTLKFNTNINSNNDDESFAFSGVELTAIGC